MELQILGNLLCINMQVTKLHVGDKIGRRWEWGDNDSRTWHQWCGSRWRPVQTFKIETSLKNPRLKNLWIMPILFYKYSKNIVATTKLQFFQISGIFPTCFGCFLSANTADKKHVDLQKFYYAILLQYSKPQANVLVIETRTRPQAFETDSKNWKSWNRDQISRLHHCITCSGEANIICSKCNAHLCLNQWWSLETHFCKCRSRRFQVSFLSRMLQISRLRISQRNSLAKFLKFNNFLFVVFAGEKQLKHVGKSQKLKKFNSEVMTTFKINFAKMLKL